VRFIIVAGALMAGQEVERAGRGKPDCVRTGAVT
jgi:hypothetical protein